MPPDEAAHSDGVLASSHLNGSPRAFEELFGRYFQRLRAYCARVGGPEGSEDLAQEVLIRAWANLDRFDTTRPMWPWLKAIATNLVVDRARARAPEVPLEPEHDEPFLDPYESRFGDRALLSEAMKKLTASQRTALRLRYLEDWNTRDVARFLGLTVPALKQLSYRARERLRTEYRRLTKSSLGWAVLSLRAFRRWLRAGAARVQTGAARVAPDLEPVRDGGFQLLIGVLGLGLALGGGTSLPSSEQLDPSSRNLAVSDRISVRPAVATASSPRGTSAVMEQDAASATAATVSEASGPRSEKRVDEAARDLVEDVADPNAGTNQPEDARILSVVFSPRYASDRTVFATGVANCDALACPAVLFRSGDGGASWSREPAIGLVADALLLPPGYGLGDDRIFAMGAEGLQVSHDAGRTFHPALVSSGPQTAGSAAISPTFGGDDPSILIGAETLMRYRDDRKTIEPVPSTAPQGPFEPAYSPAYVSDGVTFLGASRFDPTIGTTVASVYSCVDLSCRPASLEGESLRPRVRPAPDFATTGRILAFTPTAVFSSPDRGVTFGRLRLGWSNELLWDLVALPDGGILAGTIPEGAGGPAGLYQSSDGGLSWTELRSPLLGRGAASLAVSGDRIVVGLADGGVACSSDAGRTWSRRCA